MVNCHRPGHKCAIVQVGSAAATAAIVEEGFSQTMHGRVCDSGYPSVEERREEAPRICNNGLATAITSIFIGVIMLQIEVIRPCLASESVSFSYRTLYIIIYKQFKNNV